MLHHKLHEDVPELQRLEDAVTSTVFGTLVHGNAWEVLARWLRVPGDPARLAAGETDCWFWPRLAFAEPDVLLRIGAVLVLVEAKVRSGRHDRANEDDDAITGDQLLRQYRSITTPRESRSLYAEPIERAIRECQLLQAYVVDGVRSYSRSVAQFDESRSRLPEGAAAVLVRWQRLTSLLGARERWERDLRAYLISQRLDGFEGVGGWTVQRAEVRDLEVWRAARPGLDWAAVIGWADALRARPQWRTAGETAFGGFRVDAGDLRRVRMLKDWKWRGREDG